MALSDQGSSESTATHGGVSETKHGREAEGHSEMRGETAQSPKGGLARIGIVVQGSAPADNEVLTGNAQPLLREVRDLLQRLIDSGESGAIDLRAMPLSEADLLWLAGQLGKGEVMIKLNMNGESTIVETQAPGVWWVTHHNEKGKVVSEFIEVTWVPELVAAQREDAKLGLVYLDSLIYDLSQS